MMLRVLAVVSLAASITACGLFERRDVPYQDSRNEGPLQVPDDLDRPVFDDALRIPAPGSGAIDVRGVAAPASAAPGMDIDGDTFIMADSIQSAWARVGTALARMDSDVAIVEQDEAAGRYQLTATGSQKSQGFFRRMFKRDERVTETFDLTLSTDGDTTRVQVVGGGTLARGVLKRLRQRLG